MSCADLYGKRPVRSMYDMPCRDESKMEYITLFDFLLGASDSGKNSKSITFLSTSSSDLVSDGVMKDFSARTFFFMLFKHVSLSIVFIFVDWRCCLVCTR